MRLFSYIVHFDPQVSSESGKTRKMEDTEENNKLISADTPEVLNSISHQHYYVLSLPLILAKRPRSDYYVLSPDSHEVLEVLTKQDTKLLT